MFSLNWRLTIRLLTYATRKDQKLNSVPVHIILYYFDICLFHSTVKPSAPGFLCVSHMPVDLLHGSIHYDRNFYSS